LQFPKTLFSFFAWLLISNSMTTTVLSQEAGGSVDRGGAIYNAYCAACHGADGSGENPLAGQLPAGFSPAPAELASWILQDSRSDERLRKVILGGGSAVHKSSYMPSWSPTLTDGQVEDLVAYIRELKTGAAPSLVEVEPLDDELRIGKVLYSIRCLACHGATGKGDGFLLGSLTGPGTTSPEGTLPDFSLYSTIRGRSDNHFQAVIASGIAHSGLTLRTSNGWWNRTLTLAETRALILFLRSLPQPDPNP
jgi:mono/diheme cytochrome c family protein